MWKNSRKNNPRRYTNDIIRTRESYGQRQQLSPQGSEEAQEDEEIATSPARGSFLFSHVSTLFLRNNRLFIGVEMIQRLASSLDHTKRRVLGQARFDPGATEDEFWQIA